MTIKRIRNEKELRRYLDEELFLPIAAKHGLELRPTNFLDLMERTPTEMSDSLASDVLAFGDEDRWEEP
jgi:hypothetical protein